MTVCNICRFKSDSPLDHCCDDFAACDYRFMIQLRHDGATYEFAWRYAA